MSPLIESNCPGLCLNMPFSFKRAGYNIFFTRVVFPLPETPVITVKLFKGNSTLILFKLFSLAPFTQILPKLFLFFTGMLITFSPANY